MRVVVVIDGTPAGMITVVVVKVPGVVDLPPDGIIFPVPGGAPGNVPRAVDIYHHRPLPHIVVVAGYNCRSAIVDRGSIPYQLLFIHGERLYNVIGTVEKLITNDLYQYLFSSALFDNYHCHILIFIAAKKSAQHNVVNTTALIVGDGYVVNPVVAIEIEVVNPRVPVVQTPLKRFQGGRVAEQIQDRIEVQVVTRQTQVLLREVLRSHYRGDGCQNCEDRCDN